MLSTVTIKTFQYCHHRKNTKNLEDVAPMSENLQYPTHDHPTYLDYSPLQFSVSALSRKPPRTLICISVMDCEKSFHDIFKTYTHFLPTFSFPRDLTLYSINYVEIYDLPKIERAFYSSNLVNKGFKSRYTHMLPKTPRSRSSSRWDFHFHSYVLTIYVRLY